MTRIIHQHPFPESVPASVLQKDNALFPRDAVLLTQGYIEDISDYQLSTNISLFPRKQYLSLTFPSDTLYHSREMRRSSNTHTHTHTHICNNILSTDQKNVAH